MHLSPVTRAVLQGTAIPALTFITDVKDLVIMMRAIRTGLFIGIIIGMSACATQPSEDFRPGAYGAIDAGRSGN